jgi:uncharacterized protein YecT (DUF1311 family)
LLFGGIAAAQDEPDVDCDQATTQMAMNICSGREYEAADRELNAIYKKAMARQREIDVDAAAMSPAHVGAVAALRKAQRAWIDYRDGHCEAFGFAGLGGSIRPLLVSNCLKLLTTNRTKELRDLIIGLEGPD